MKKIFYTLSALVSLFIVGGIVYANPSTFASTASTSTATTSPVFLVNSGALATTTLPLYDSYEQSGTNEVNSGKINSPDSAVLLIQFTASSTVSTLGWYYEYSQDGVDWYADAIVTRNASTTVNNLTANNSYTWTFASSTMGGATVSATNNRATKAVQVPVPTRYIRPVFYCTSITTANCAVWATFVPKKQNN